MNTTYLSLEIKRIVRSPQFTIFTIGMPLAMFLLFGSIFGKFVTPNGLASNVQTMINPRSSMITEPLPGHSSGSRRSRNVGQNQNQNQNQFNLPKSRW